MKESFKRLVRASLLTVGVLTISANTAYAKEEISKFEIVQEENKYIDVNQAIKEDQVQARLMEMPIAEELRILEAYELTIGEEFIGNFEDSQEVIQEIRDMVEKLLYDNQLDYDLIPEIRLEKKSVLKDEITDIKDLRYKVLYQEKIEETTKIDQDIKIDDFISKYSIDKDEFIKLNELEEKSEILKKDMEVKVYEFTPKILVRQIEEKSHVKKIAFKTRKVKTDKLYIGESKVSQEGISGREKINTKYIYENGDLAKKYVESKEILRKKQDKIILIGNKERPKGMATNSFIKPTVGRYTSLFEYRWGSFHTGVDIANGMGTSIVASDGGRVIAAGWNSYGLGNHVKIDHGNGYVTLYGHMVGVDVKVGDRVDQGEHIGRMGSTGFSTGPHVHFEVIKDGVKLNPLNFIK